MTIGVRRRWQSASASFIALREAVSMVVQAGRREFTVACLLQTVGAVAIGMQLWVSRDLFGVLLAEPKISRLLAPLVLMLAASITLELCQIAGGEINALLAELFQWNAMGIITDETLRADVVEFERPAFHDQLMRAAGQAQGRATQMVAGVSGLVGGLVSIGAVMVALGAFEPVLLVLGIASIVPIAVAAHKNSLDSYDLTRLFTPQDRQRVYLQTLLTDRSAAAELHALDAGPFLQQRLVGLYAARISALRQLMRARLVRTATAATLSAVLGVAPLVVLAYAVASHRISVATAGAAFIALFQLTARLRLLNAGLSQLLDSKIFLADYRALRTRGLEKATRKIDGIGPRFRPGHPASLTVRGVTFAYPASERPVLDHVSMRVEPGEIVALVGENGSGKSTLAKVIAGLYDAHSGSIELDVDGASLRDRDERRRATAVVFQDYLRFKSTVTENIGLGDPPRINDRAGVAGAANRTGAAEMIARLPQAFETLLGAEFAGAVDLSTGQWQRIALARSVFRDSSLVILDEPASALDARSESLLFERLPAILDGRTAIIISHRFSTVRAADRIVVLADGRIVEDGSHHDLVARDGTYAELFRTHAAAYR